MVRWCSAFLAFWIHRSINKKNDRRNQAKSTEFIRKELKAMCKTNYLTKLAILVYTGNYALFHLALNYSIEVIIPSLVLKYNCRFVMDNVVFPWWSARQELFSLTTWLWIRSSLICFQLLGITKPGWRTFFYDWMTLTLWKPNFRHSPFYLLQITQWSTFSAFSLRFL